MSNVQMTQNGTGYRNGKSETTALPAYLRTDQESRPPLPASRGEWHLIYVTPKLANELLASMHENQRKSSPPAVDRLCEQMESGEFYLTHQGSAFLADGRNVDGRHRLTAVVKSGRSVWMWMYHGLSAEAMLVVDNHRIRPDWQALFMQGHSWVTKDVVAIAQAMNGSVSATVTATKLTRQKVREFVIEHQDAILFAHPKKTVSGYSNAGIRAVVARAWYTQDRERLAEFDQCLIDGMPVSADAKHDSGALRLRSFYRERGSASAGGSQTRAMIYRKAKSALRHFLDRRCMTKLCEVQAEIFPIPGDEDK